MNIECEKTNRGWVGIIKENGNTIASWQLERQGDYMVIHNTVNIWTPRTLKIYKEVFELVKEGIKKSGCKYIVTGCIDGWEKKIKYWRIMGFTLLNAVEMDGQLIKTAILEL